MAQAHGLEPLLLPNPVSYSILGTAALVESVLSSLPAPLDVYSEAHICVSFDAEWNISRRTGVSIIQIAPHAEWEKIYIIPVRYQLAFSMLSIYLTNH